MATSDAVFGFLLLTIAFVGTARAQTMPTGCTYADGLYECSYSTLSSNSLIPLAASGFNPIPQRLRLTDISGTLSSAILNTDFANISTASFDTNYPSTLEIECIAGASITVSSGFLANVNVEDFKIINCNLGTISNNDFSELGEIDRFTIENGTISALESGFLTGVTIRRNTSITPAYPKQFGEFRMKNTKLTGGWPSAALNGQTKMYSVMLRGMGLTTLDSATFSGLTNLRYLDISENPFTTLPSDLFSGLSNLAVIDMYGMTVECSCTNLWYLETADTNYLTLNGDIICNNALSDWNYKLAWNYYYDTCVAEPEECSTGILLLEACLSPIEISGLSVGFVGFVLGWVALGITISTKKAMGASGTPRRKPGAAAKKKTAPKKAPKGGWA